MNSGMVRGPKSRKPDPGKSGAKLRPERLVRMLAVETVPDTGLEIRLCANETECAALADAYGLVAVQSFEAGFQVRKQGQKRYAVRGVLHALVTQTCAVSLEPFETLVDASIGVEFAPSGDKPGGAATFAGSQDPPDPMINGQIDLGALAAEFLALNLDPYPRKPGVTFEDVYMGGEAPGTDSPFAALRHRS